MFYYTYEGDKPILLTMSNVINIQEDIKARVRDYTEYNAMREAMAYIMMVLSIVEHKKRIKIMETIIPLLREYIRKSRKPLGRLEEIVKLSINAALNNEQRYKVLQTMGQEYTRSNSNPELIEAKTNYGWNEVCRVIANEGYMIGSRLTGTEYESIREKDEDEREEEPDKEKSKWALIMKEIISKKESREKRKRKLKETWTPKRIFETNEEQENNVKEKEIEYIIKERKTEKEKEKSPLLNNKSKKKNWMERQKVLKKKEGKKTQKILISQSQEKCLSKKEKFILLMKEKEKIRKLEEEEEVPKEEEDKKKKDEELSWIKNEQRTKAWKECTIRKIRRNQFKINQEVTLNSLFQ
jgi:hypothetical protein